MSISPGQNQLTEHRRAVVKGEERLMSWIHDGTLLSVDKVQAAWGVDRQTVDTAREGGEIFSIWLKGKHWYPCEVLKFERADLAAINRALDGIDPSSKLIFLLHKHGGLAGKTPADAVVDGKFDDVLRLAAVWANI